MKKQLLVGVVTLLMASILNVGLASAQGPTPSTTPNQAQAGTNDQTPTYACSLTSGATPTITADEAKTAALAANPGTTALSVSLDDENGCLVYGVELSNGADVKVDAGTGQVLHTDAAGPEDSAAPQGQEGVEG